VSPLYLVKLKIAQNSRPVIALRTVELIVPNFHRMLFSVRLLSMLVRKIFYESSDKNFYNLMGFYEKCIFKLNTVNFNMQTKVKML